MLYEDAVSAAVDLHMTAGGPADGWFAGVTSDIEHSVRRHNLVNGAAFDCLQCVNQRVARKVERHLRSLGYDGRERKADGTFVYIYKITRDTLQDC